MDETDGSDPVNRGLSRRQFAKAAVAIGGASALSACLDRTDDPDVAQGPEDLSTLPASQHAWNEFLATDDHGNDVAPRHRVLLLLNYRDEGTPSDADRETAESAFRSLERAYRRGNDGLLFTVGYSPAYFDRFDADLPADVDLQRPEEVLSAVGEDPAKADHYDAVLLLTADFGSIVLSAEAALFGEIETVNGVDVEGTLDDLFERAERRTGVVGKGLPAERLDEERIPDHAPLSMGFKSGYRDSLPSEDKVTITGGPFDQAATQALSRLHIDLGRWYDRDQEERIDQMFSPDPTHDDVGETAEGLGGDSGVTKETVERIDAHADEYGRVGHTAKTAAARDEDFDPVILRRSEGIATDVTAEDVAGFNFTSVQEGIEDFVATRKAMNPDEYDDDVADPHHGIVDYLETRSRGTFLVPPRRLRALPPPRPGGGE